MSKLVRVEHERCGEFWGYTYLLAPDDITEERLSDDARAAQAEHLAAVTLFKAVRPAPSPSYSVQVTKDLPDDMTVGELRRRQEDQKRAYAEWEALKRAANRSFSACMTPRGYETLPESEDVPEVSLSWGHRHGEPLDPSITPLDVSYDADE